jgi:hypothetical protein
MPEVLQQGFEIITVDKFKKVLGALAGNGDEGLSDFNYQASS